MRSAAFEMQLFQGVWSSPFKLALGSHILFPVRYPDKSIHITGHYCGEYWNCVTNFLYF